MIKQAQLIGSLYHYQSRFTDVTMLAKDLKPGMSFKRAGHREYREVASVKDLDTAPDTKLVMKNKLEVHTTNGDHFWIYKSDTVHLEKK